MSKKILIVDDEIRLLKLIRMILESRGYEVTEAFNGQDALTKAKTTPFDLILMDVMMPVMDGFTACKMIRNFYTSPIIMLTAKGEDYDQVKGLENGADDYIIKPFTPMVLSARIEAALRRSQSSYQNASEQMRLSFGDLHIDEGARDVYLNQERIETKKKEFDLLLYLAKNYNISLSIDQIVEHVWGYDYLGTDSTVYAHMNRLRKKLKHCGDYLQTVRGVGYKFEVPNET